MATKSKKAAEERQEAALAVQEAADVVGVEGVTQFAQGANTLENAKEQAPRRSRQRPYWAAWTWRMAS